MEYVKLGKSEINVSRIGLGCMGFGEPDDHHAWTIGYESAKQIIEVALDKGINFFDTAMGYSHGTSEQYLGKAIRELTKRENAVIATKFLPRNKEEIENGIDGRRHVLNCLRGSLERLGTDYIDLYICHMWDYQTPIEEIMGGLNEAIKGGYVRAIGISNCYAWQIEKANAYARQNGLAQFISYQGHYNLIAREDEREIKPCCDENGIALTPYSPLASGRLVKDSTEKTLRGKSDYIAKSKYDSTVEQDSEIIRRVAELADKKGMTRTQIALGWLLAKVTSPIVGATKTSHIEQANEAVSIHLTAEETAYLEQPYVPHKLVGVMSFNHK